MNTENVIRIRIPPIINKKVVILFAHVFFNENIISSLCNDIENIPLFRECNNNTLRITNVSFEYIRLGVRIIGGLTQAYTKQIGLV